MRTAAPQEGQDHDTLLPGVGAFVAALVLAALTAASPALPAAAQAAPPCTAIEDDAERLACYDRALRASAPASAPSPPASPRAAADQPPAASAAAAAPTATSRAPAETAEPRRERRLRESTAAPAPAAPVAGDGEDDDDDRIVPLLIVGAHARPGREMIFTTEDGATWVQTDTQRLGNLPDTPFEAELKPGSMGSYFLVPKDHGRAIRVRNAAR